ncbi:MAG: hypothetical protein ACRDN0_34480 [Trebonia sp.]
MLPEERKRLDLIDGAIRSEAPRLAAKFDMFTRLVRDDGKPPAERQFRQNGPWRYKAFARRRARRYCYAILTLFLVVLAAILLTELT